MKRLFVTVYDSKDKLENILHSENFNPKTKIVILDKENSDDSNQLQHLIELIKQKFNISDRILSTICLKNGVPIENVAELKDDEFVYALTSEANGVEQPSDIKMLADDWITLNVGGTIFTTTRTTLMREADSFFGRMFSTEFQNWSHKKLNGAITIDRSSRYFEIILDYLR